MNETRAKLPPITLLAWWFAGVLACAPAYPEAAAYGSTLCATDEQCIAPAICDLDGTMTCVQCTMNKHDACTGAAPVCVNHICNKCTEHAQCAVSNVCLPDGTCADPAQVAYVQAGGSGNACTRTAPCGTLDAGVKASRPFVKMAVGTVTNTKETIIDGKTVMILADPGAKLTRATPGVILELENTRNIEANVAIYDLEITGGIGISNAVVSIPIGNASRLTLTRVTISDNQGIGLWADAGIVTMSHSTLQRNMGGGILIARTLFDMTNNYIVQNGSAMSAIGGMNIAQVIVGGTYRFAFNTVAGNTAATVIPLHTGINCATLGMPVVFDSNIIYGNSVGGGGKQIGGSTMCKATYSDVGPDGMPGVGNINVNPRFENAAQGNFRLMSTSPAKDAANPAASLADDFDGDARPQGQRFDMGADEIAP